MGAFNRKQSVKKGIWYLGEKRKIKPRVKKGQQGKGFPIGLLASESAPLLGEIATSIFKTIFWKRKKKKTMREKILLQRRVVSKKVTLPNGQTFHARYERTSRRNLPTNVTIRNNRIGPRQQRTRKTQQDGSIMGNIVKLGAKLGASNLLRQGVSADTKALSSDIGKTLIDEEIKHAPDLYRLGASKIKNKNVRKALKSDVANYIAEETQKKEKGDLNNLFGG